jgi:phage antirepressor YoqD-like protein/biotin operon repressor
MQKKCLPNKKIENGKPTYWDKAEVTVLIYFMQNNKTTMFNSQASQAFTDGLRSVSTDLTPALKLNKDFTVTAAVTVKELAKDLNVAESTIKNNINELRQVLGEVKKNNQGGYLLTEKQATLIKLKLRDRNNLKDNSVISQIGNDLEFFALLKKREEEQKLLDAYRDKRIEELTVRAELAESVVNRIADGKGCYTINQTAKALKLPYGNIKLFEKLRAMQILNLDNSPKQEHINNGNFKVVVKFINEKVGNKSVTLTTSKGLVYLAKKFNTEIDKNVLPDYE